MTNTAMAETASKFVEQTEKYVRQLTKFRNSLILSIPGATRGYAGEAPFETLYLLNKMDGIIAQLNAQTRKIAQDGIAPVDYKATPCHLFEVGKTYGTTNPVTILAKDEERHTVRFTDRHGHDQWASLTLEAFRNESGVYYEEFIEVTENEFGEGILVSASEVA